MSTKRAAATAARRLGTPKRAAAAAVAAEQDGTPAKRPAHRCYSSQALGGG